MKKYLFFLILILFSIISFSKPKFLSKEFFSKQSLNYIHLDGNTLKLFLLRKDYYIIDTRDVTKIAEGYLPNSIIAPLSLFSWLYAVVPESSNVILITDEANLEAAVDTLIKLGKYKLYGYCIFDEINKTSSFNLQVIEYDPNTKESITNIVNNKGNIIDIREIAEYKDTGVIKEAHLIPLSSFFTNYSNIPKEGNVYVYCKSGMRAVAGMSYAKRAGYNNKFIIMKGGMNKAIEEGYPLVPYEENY